ncbi:MAG: metallophosphoesterase family protein [Akkermansia sp.]|nr:metallophosphoesterase family protein [Akkermansia sp.]
MARTAIISDIHANMHALAAVMTDVQQEACTDVVCLGDVVGYNAYPKECLDYVRSLNCPIVKGNHDEEVARSENTRMNPVARAAMEWTRRQLTAEDLNWLMRLQFQRMVNSSYMIVHSTLDQPMAWNYIMNANDAAANFARQFKPLCLHGHTHVPRVFSWNGTCTEHPEFIAELAANARVEIPLQQGTKYFINAGSVGQPRDNDPRACYGIYDTDRNSVTLKRVEYDVAGAQQAVLAAGLPEYLAERLARGC